MVIEIKIVLTDSRYRFGKNIEDLIIYGNVLYLDLRDDCIYIKTIRL